MPFWRVLVIMSIFMSAGLIIGIFGAVAHIIVDAFIG